MTNRPTVRAFALASPACVVRHAAAMFGLLLASCSSVTMPSFLHNPAAEAVVYALGPRDGYTSPLNGSLKPACPALVFDGDALNLTGAHEAAINGLKREIEGDKKARLLIAGYAPPNLPQDHARALSDRRALAVRQRFIELGIEAANIQSVGFGNDFSPSSPSSAVVVIYRQN